MKQEVTSTYPDFEITLFLQLLSSLGESVFRVTSRIWFWLNYLTQDGSIHLQFALAHSYPQMNPGQMRGSVIFHTSLPRCQGGMCRLQEKTPSQGLICVLNVCGSCSKRSSGRESGADRTGCTVICSVHHHASKWESVCHDAKSGLRLNWRQILQCGDLDKIG